MKMKCLLGKSLNEAWIISVRVRSYGKYFISVGKVSLHGFTASLNLEFRWWNSTTQPHQLHTQTIPSCVFRCNSKKSLSDCLWRMSKCNGVCQPTVPSINLQLWIQFNVLSFPKSTALSVMCMSQFGVTFWLEWGQTPPRSKLISAQFCWRSSSVGTNLENSPSHDWRAGNWSIVKDGETCRPV